MTTDQSRAEFEAPSPLTRAIGTLLWISQNASEEAIVDAARCAVDTAQAAQAQGDGWITSEDGLSRRLAAPNAAARCVPSSPTKTLYVGGAPAASEPAAQGEPQSLEEWQRWFNRSAMESARGYPDAPDAPAASEPAAQAECTYPRCEMMTVPRCKGACSNPTASVTGAPLICSVTGKPLATAAPAAQQPAALDARVGQEDETDWTNHFRVEQQGFWWWVVKCGTGTRTIFKARTKTAAEEMAQALLTAFLDGEFVGRRALSTPARAPEPVSDGRIINLAAEQWPINDARTPNVGKLIAFARALLKEAGHE